MDEEPKHRANGGATGSGVSPFACQVSCVFLALFVFRSPGSHTACSGNQSMWPSTRSPHRTPWTASESDLREAPPQFAGLLYVIKWCQFWCQLVLHFGAFRCTTLPKASLSKPALIQAFFNVFPLGARQFRVTKIALKGQCSTIELPARASS